jgi:hypothetical protein
MVATRHLLTTFRISVEWLAATGEQKLVAKTTNKHEVQPLLISDAGLLDMQLPEFRGQLIYKTTRCHIQAIPLKTS